jgi:chromosome segregation ATPase
VIEAMSEDVAFRALLKASELADLQRRIAEAEHALRQKKVLLERSGNALRRERERRYGLQRQLDAGQKETDRLGRVVEELQRELDFIQRTKDRGAPPASAR